MSVTRKQILLVSNLRRSSEGVAIEISEEEKEAITALLEEREKLIMHSQTVTEYLIGKAIPKNVWEAVTYFRYMRDDATKSD